MSAKIFFFCAYLLCSIITVSKCKFKKPVPYKENKPENKYSNPNFINDRVHGPNRPILPEKWTNRLVKPFHPSWQDYCDPAHCKAFYKPACGLNRKRMKFKWFQSICHLATWNYCTTYRGTIQYDSVAANACTLYVQELRSGCEYCESTVLEPVCGVSSWDGHIALFKNTCAMQTANCKVDSLQEYDQGDLRVCSNYMNLIEENILLK